MMPRLQGHGVRVTHVLHDFDGGGLESLVSRIAERLNQRTAIRSSVISLSGRIGRVGSEASQHFDTMIAMRPLRGVSMVAPTGLVAAIRRTRADVVHLHSGVWFKGALAARMARVPRVIFTEHGREHNDTTSRMWLDRQASRMTDFVVPVSLRLEHYMHEVVGIPSAQIRLVQNGIDTIRYSPGPRPAALMERLAIPAGAVVVGSMGRLEPVKRYDRLLRAFASATGSMHDGRSVLVLFGDGSAREELQQLARDLGIEAQVRFPGWVAPDPDVYRLLDVFALTSKSEGLSLSLLEAMACGAVPVVNDVGANADVLGEELRDHVAAADDQDGFTRLLALALHDDARRIFLRPRARMRVEQHYRFDRLIDQYVSLYTRLPHAR